MFSLSVTLSNAALSHRWWFAACRCDLLQAGTRPAKCAPGKAAGGKHPRSCRMFGRKNNEDSHACARSYNLGRMTSSLRGQTSTLRGSHPNLYMCAISLHKSYSRMPTPMRVQLTSWRLGIRISRWKSTDALPSCAGDARSIPLWRWSSLPARRPESRGERLQ